MEHETRLGQSDAVRINERLRQALKDYDNAA